eukprot:355656-Chlamydomonas_euryale.AAC.10
MRWTEASPAANSLLPRVEGADIERWWWWCVCVWGGVPAEENTALSSAAMAHCRAVLHADASVGWAKVGQRAGS